MALTGIKDVLCIMRCMANKLDFALRRLETLVEKYCIEGYEDEATEAIAWVWEYMHDYPQEDDVEEAISLVKKAETYISDSGRPIYAGVRREAIRRMRVLLNDRRREIAGGD